MDRHWCESSRWPFWRALSQILWSLSPTLSHFRAYFWVLKESKRRRLKSKPIYSQKWKLLFQHSVELFLRGPSASLSSSQPVSQIPRRQICGVVVAGLISSEQGLIWRPISLSPQLVPSLGLICVESWTVSGRFVSFHLYRCVRVCTCTFDPGFFCVCQCGDAISVIEFSPYFILFFVTCGCSSVTRLLSPSKTRLSEWPPPPRAAGAAETWTAVWLEDCSLPSSEPNKNVAADKRVSTLP